MGANAPNFRVETQTESELRAALARAEQENARLREILHQLDSFTHQRAIACRRAANSYAKEKPDEPYWERSERCAQQEAEYIHRIIRKARNEPATPENAWGELLEAAAVVCEVYDQPLYRQLQPIKTIYRLKTALTKLAGGER